jgi:23S rRNA pseudouridine2605 synthase
VVSTARDQAARPRVIDLVPPQDGLFTVGRLDISSEGAILVTNDGELANRLTHPRYGIAKTYQVEVAGRLEADLLRQLRRGIYLAEAFVRMSEVRIRRRNKSSTTLEVVLREGRNREIRRMLARVGHKVLRLKRIAVGPLRLGELPAGAYRPLESQEVQALRRASRGGSPSSGRRSSGKKPFRRKLRKVVGDQAASEDRDAGRRVNEDSVAKKPAGRKPAAKKRGGKTPVDRPSRGKKSTGKKRAGGASSKKKSGGKRRPASTPGGRTARRASGAGPRQGDADKRPRRKTGKKKGHQ